MCNRYAQTKRERQLKTDALGQNTFALTPRYNIAPTQTAPVVLADNGSAVLKDFVWGWKTLFGPQLNARAETAAEKVFRDAWQLRHCIVPADGFFEWKQMPEGKQPYHFLPKSREGFWFAGLWQDDQFTILTAPAQGPVRSLHDRMPIILPDSEIDWWLADERVKTGDELIQRCASADLLDYFPVTRRMSNSRYAEPDCVEPIVLPQQELNLS